MRSEENPPENLSHVAPEQPGDCLSEPSQIPAEEINPEPIEAILVESAPPLKHNMENMAAKGGAIGAIVLGCLTLAGSLITNFSIINGVLGLIMGIWGLKSQNRKTAWIGISLCLIGILVCLFHVSGIVTNFLRAVDANDL